MLGLLVPGVGMGGGTGIVILIDGSTTIVLSIQYDSIMVVSNTDTSNWWVI